MISANRSIVTIDGVSDFDPDQIFDCGQCFRFYKEADGSYTGVANNRVVNVQVTDAGKQEQTRNSKTLILNNSTEEDVENIWSEYFDLDTDYGKIKKELMSRDDVISEAIKYGEGIRILRQDIWETLVSFIISQNNNIPRIRKCIELLAENFGEEVENPMGFENSASESRKFFALPEPEVLASLTEEDLAVCRLGYRAKYLTATGRKIAEDGGKTLRALAMGEGSDEEALEYLRTLPGVGPKVAGCISLFGLGRKSAFPIDVWVKRVMSRLYGFDEKDVRGIADFAKDRFGAYGGVAQQYLFYYMRYIA